MAKFSCSSKFFRVHEEFLNLEGERFEDSIGPAYFQYSMSCQFDGAGSSPRCHCRIPNRQRAISFVGNETASVDILEQRESLKKFGQPTLKDELWRFRY
jgi:hypothetical protein